MPRALITGVTGQDGQHLSELLLSKGYEVWGLVRGHSADRIRAYRAEFPSVHLVEGDLTDLGSLIRAVEAAQPDEIYNLGSLSFVGLSFRQPEATAAVTGLGPLRLLEAIRLSEQSGIRFYQ
ncbi:MAG: GDP-mannose 4,6-dehydratase, partial [Actinomycetota bacterium]